MFWAGLVLEHEVGVSWEGEEGKGVDREREEGMQMKTNPKISEE